MINANQRPYETSPDQAIFEAGLRVRLAMLEFAKRGNISRVSPAPPDKTIEEILQFPMGKTSPFAFVLKRLKMEKFCLGLASRSRVGTASGCLATVGPGGTPWTALQLAPKRAARPSPDVGGSNSRRSPKVSYRVALQVSVQHLDSYEIVEVINCPVPGR